MSITEILLIGVALSMDAFAVAVVKGMSMKKVNYRHAAVIGVYFGIFQALMPTIGWFGGSYAKTYIENFDHWIAFILLAIIGGNMLKEALHPDGDEDSSEKEFRLDHKELFVLAVATSIDALAVGITLAIENVNIALAAVLIGCTTFTISFFGVKAGNKFGSKYEKKSQIAGGIILILIGLKILLEHLGVLNL